MRKADVLFDTICASILAKYRANPHRGTYGSARAPVAHLLKTFSGERVSKISPRDFWSRHVPRAWAENPSRNLNNERKIFIQVLNIAHDMGIHKRAPRGIPYPNGKAAVGRALTQEEIKRLLDACDNPTLKLQIKLSLVTGMRLRETLRLKWEYIDLEQSMITLPAKIVKTNRERRLAICSSLTEELKELKSKSKADFVFPAPARRGKAVNSNKTAWKTLCKKAGIKARWHDLRHTAASLKISAGISETIVTQEMGLSKRVLTQIYLHLNFGDFKKSAEAASLFLRLK